MAQNITLLGATYSAVPAVELPKTGGGTATFTDVTDSTAVANDVLTGKYFYTSAGVRTEGTNTGGGGDENRNPYDSVVFYDYDGSIVVSYSKTEFTAMPANPSHEGLVSQGWNWTKAEIDDYLNDYPEATVNVGQMYITDDGKTRLYVHFEEGRTYPYLGLGVNGTVEIDWGDNSNIDTLTGGDLSVAQYVEHDYQSAGDYIIKLIPTSGSFSILGISTTSYILRKYDPWGTSGVGESRVYLNALKKVQLGSNVVLNGYAFLYCCSLSSISIPSTITNIEPYLFSNCYSLRSVTIPNNVTNIEGYAFNNCYSLESIAIPNRITNIGGYAFTYCYSLRSVTISSTMTSFGNYAFNYCYSLNSIIIPGSITEFGTYTFQNCYSLRSVTISDGVTKIGNYAFSSCRSLSSVTLPDTITSFGNYVFQNCYSLEFIAIPSGITSIGTFSFQNCYSLRSVTIPNSMTSINTSVFASCYSLSSFTIPNRITNIGSNAFNLCNGMKEYHVLSVTPPSLTNKNAFNSMPSDCIIYVPSESVSTYREATNWSNYSSHIIGE